jgi:hypothetical protein
MPFSEKERKEAIEDLRELLKPGDTVYTVLRNVSRSGMTRDIDCYVIKEDSPRWISRLVAKAIEASFNEKRDAVRVGGCGMDMGFHIVHNLSYALYPDSFVCIGQGCPANDHSNGDRDYSAHQHSRGASGYALKHRWM